MKIRPTKLSAVLLIEPKVFSDSRGFFMETWNQQKFAEAGLNFAFVQDNQQISAGHLTRPALPAK